MDKQERLLKTIAGENTDRVPAALWRHWPGDDQRAADLARSTLEFQQSFDWDFVNICPSSHYQISDYGIQDEWEGNLEGRRTVIRRAIYRSLEWTELRPLDPNRGTLGRHQEAIRLVCDGLRTEPTPVVCTVYSPLTQAQALSGAEILIRHIRTNPDRVQTGLNALTESTLRLIDAVKKLPVAGIYYVIDHANADILSEEEYRAFGLPYDRKIIESLPEKWWLNLVQVRGGTPMLKVIAPLPAQVVHWPDQDSEIELAQGKLILNHALCGGLSRWRHLHNGTPTSIREQARLVLSQLNHRRLILSAGDPLLVTTPLSNIRAVRDVVEGK